jgi:hypothetical protein
MRKKGFGRKGRRQRRGPRRGFGVCKNVRIDRVCKSVRNALSPASRGRRIYKSECASASTAAPYFVALHVLQLLSRRRMQYAVRVFEISFLASFLLVLCRFFAFLASFRLFSESFLQLPCWSSSFEVSHKFTAGVLYCVWCVALLAGTRI